jgi:hypothetical protein
LFGNNGEGNLISFYFLNLPEGELPHPDWFSDYYSEGILPEENR